MSAVLQPRSTLDERALVEKKLLILRLNKRKSFQKYVIKFHSLRTIKFFGHNYDKLIKI